MKSDLTILPVILLHTEIVAQTVDTYYRRTCSADYLTKVAVPLLCFSALDDPICTNEAIPWDEVT